MLADGILAARSPLGYGTTHWAAQMKINITCRDVSMAAPLLACG
jgi:hypothetical protein